VLHARGDAVAPFRGGREYAMGIPSARFVALERQNHVLIDSEPAWLRFLSEVRSFLAES
jgi:pimeloyl-ACP methyl ester carboxylesterase